MEKREKKANCIKIQAGPKIDHSEVAYAVWD
jgi:hypothetical protein